MREMHNINTIRGTIQCCSCLFIISDDIGYLAMHLISHFYITLALQFELQEYQLDITDVQQLGISVAFQSPSSYL